MELKALKLHIINEVLQNEDPDVLHTVAQLLRVHHLPTDSKEHFTPEWEIDDARTPYSEECTKEIQQSIDELFNP